GRGPVSLFFHCMRRAWAGVLTLTGIKRAPHPFVDATALRRGTSRLLPPHSTRKRNLASVAASVKTPRHKAVASPREKGRLSLLAANVRTPRRKTVASSNRRFSQLAVNQPPNAEWIAILQLIRQDNLRRILITDCPHETKDCARTNRCGPPIRGGGVWTTVHHRWPNFNTSGKAVENHPSSFLFDGLNHVTDRLRLGFRCMNCRRQLSFEIAGEVGQLLEAIVGNQ